MKQGIYTIASNSLIADKTWRMRLLGDTAELKRGGQFVDVALDGYFLRRPIAATCWDAEGFDMIYKVVGKGTEVLAAMQPGAKLDVLTGLGNGFDAGRTESAALVACGGVGASPTFTLVRDLIAAGKKVTVALGFNTASEIVLEDEYKAIGATVLVATMDGSKGTKGFVTDAVAAAQPVFDHFYTCGPKVMMKAVCMAFDVPGEASLEERMGCGCGICYGCTCHTTEGPRRICADGPVFSKEDIIW